MPQKNCKYNPFYKLNINCIYNLYCNIFCNVFSVNLYPQPYEQKQLICILNLPKANLYPQPLPNRAVDLFPR